MNSTDNPSNTKEPAETLRSSGGFGLRRWRAGDRVTRQVVMDDGTWQRQGDKCLARSALKHGEVFKRSERRSDEIIVRWDDGTERAYLDHGVQEELPHTRPNVEISHAPSGENKT